MTMDECMILCRLEVAEHRSLLDKIQLAENLATGDKNNGVSIARATITIYVPPLPYSAPLSTDDSCNKQTASSSPRQSPSLHTPPAAPAPVQPYNRTEVNSYVQSCTRHTLPNTVDVTADSSTDSSTGSTCNAAARCECDNSDGASVVGSVEVSHTVVNNNNKNSGDEQPKDSRELLRKIAESYRILNRRDAPNRPTSNYSVVRRRVINRIVYTTHKTGDNVLPRTADDRMTTSSVNDENSIASTKLSVVIDRARLGDRLNALLDNGTMQPSTSAAGDNINSRREHEARDSRESSTSSTDHSVESSSSLEQYLMDEYAKCRAKGKYLGTIIRTRRQRELLQIEEDCSLKTNEEELPPVRHRKSLYRIKTRLSSKMKKKQALLATFRKGTMNGWESVKVSPKHRPIPPSTSSSDNESSSAHSAWEHTVKRSECIESSQVDNESSSSSDTEMATTGKSENSAVEVKPKIRALSSGALAGYLAHMKLKQPPSHNLGRSETATMNNKDEGTDIAVGDEVSAGGELNGEPLVTGDAGGGGSGSGGGGTVVIQCSTQTHTNSKSHSDGASDSGETVVTTSPAAVQCSTVSPDTTRKITRILRRQRTGRRFFHHHTIPYIKPWKRVQLRKTFSASLTNLVDKSIEISGQKGTLKMNNRGEASVTGKLRNSRKAKTPRRKRLNGTQDGSSGQSGVEEDVHIAPGPVRSSSTDSVSYTGYSICSKLSANNNNTTTQEKRHQQLDTDNENNSLQSRVAQSDNTTSDTEYGPGECIHSANEPRRYFTHVASINNDRTVDNVTSGVDDAPGNTNNAQPARDSSERNAAAQPAADSAGQQPGQELTDVKDIIISDVRSLATCNDDEALSATSTVMVQPQHDSTTIRVVPEYLLQPRRPSVSSDNEQRHTKPTRGICGLVNILTGFDASNSNNRISTGRSETCQEESRNNDERLRDINRRLHNAHQTPNSVPSNIDNTSQSVQQQQQQNQPPPPPPPAPAPESAQPPLRAQVLPKRTYTRRKPTKKQIQESERAEMLKQTLHYQQTEQQRIQQQQQLLAFGRHRSPPPQYPSGMQGHPRHPDAGEMYNLPPNMIPRHQYQSLERTRVPPTSTVTSQQPLSYRTTVNNLINPNMPPLSRDAIQSMNPALDLRYPMNIPFPPLPALPPPPPLPPPVQIYSGNITNPMIHSPTNPSHSIIPTSHMNPQNTMLSTPTLPTNIGPVGSTYPISIIPPSTQTSRSAAPPHPRVPASDAEMCKKQEYTGTEFRAPTSSSEQPASRASVQSPPAYVTQRTSSMVHSASHRQVQQQSTVQSPIGISASGMQNVVQTSSQAADTRITIQGQAHLESYLEAQRNHALAPVSTRRDRVRVEHLVYAPIEDIVNKVVQSPAIRQHDRLLSPARSEVRVQSRASAQNVVQSVAEDQVKNVAQLPSQRKPVGIIRTPSGNVLNLVQPPVEVKRATVRATEEPRDEHVQDEQVAAAVLDETLIVSDSDTLTSEEVNNSEDEQSSTICNTTRIIEQSVENNEAAIPASVHAVVDTPRARPRIRNRVRVRRYGGTPSAVGFSRTRRFVNRRNYRRRRTQGRTSVRQVPSEQDTATKNNDDDDTVKCELNNEQAIKTTPVSNNELAVPSTSRKENADPCGPPTPDRMNIPVNFYSQTNEQPMYASTVISQGIETLQLAQTYIETYHNNKDKMHELQQVLREMIANVNTTDNVKGEHAASKISHTEQLLKQFLYNQKNIRTEFIIRHEIVTGTSGDTDGTQQSDSTRATFTVQRFQESLERLSVLLTQVRDSAPSVASEYVQTEGTRTSEEQPDTMNNNSEPDEPVVNVQVPWSRASNTVVDNPQPSTSRQVSTSNQSSGGDQAATTPSQDDVKLQVSNSSSSSSGSHSERITVLHKYALCKLEERKLDNTKCTVQPPAAVNTRAQNEIVTELLDNGVKLQYSIPVHTPAGHHTVQPDEVSANVPSASQVARATSDDTPANNEDPPEVSTELQVDTPPPTPPRTTDILSHQSTTSGPASGIVGPCCQICCSVDKHEEAKRNAQKTSTAANNEESAGNHEQQQQQQQQQSMAQSIEPTVITANQQLHQQPMLQPIEPTVITANQQLQPMSQPIERTIITASQQLHQQQQQQSMTQPIEPTVITINQQPQQPVETPARDTFAVSTRSSRPVQVTERMDIPCTINIPPILATNNGRLQILLPQPTIVINGSQTLTTTTTSEVQPATEREDTISHLPPQSAVARVEDVVSVVMPAPGTSHIHMPGPCAATSDRRTSADSECLLSSPPCKTEEYQHAAGTQRRTSTSHSNKRHTVDTPSDGSKRTRHGPSTSSDTITPAAGQPVPAADFLAAVNQRLDNTNSLIMSLIKKKDRRRSSGTATAVRDDELVSQSSATSMYSFNERIPSRSTTCTHRPPEPHHYNPNVTPLSQHRHHTPRLPTYNVPSYQRLVYSNQHTVRPQSYQAEEYVRHRAAVAPFQEPLRLPSRYDAYPAEPHPERPPSASASVHHSQVQQAEYPLTMLTSMVNEHPQVCRERGVRRRSESLPQYLPLPRRTNIDMPPPTRQMFNNYEYRSRRSSHRNTPSTMQPSAGQPNREMISQIINYMQGNSNHNNNNNNDTDCNITTMYPVIEVPPFPAEVLQNKRYKKLLCKYYQEPKEHALMKCTINYKSEHTKTKWNKQRTDYNNNKNNIITSIRDKNTVIDRVQGKRNPYAFDHMHRQQVRENKGTCATEYYSKKRYVPGDNCDINTADTAQSDSVIVCVETSTQKKRQPGSEQDEARLAIEMAAARLQVEALNTFIEDNWRTLQEYTESSIRTEALLTFAVTDRQECDRLFYTFRLTDRDQYYRSLWCMWCVAENKQLYEFYRTVTQLQIRAGQTPFAIRIFIELLRCKYFGCVRKFTEDQRKRK